MASATAPPGSRIDLMVQLLERCGATRRRDGWIRSVRETYERAGPMSNPACDDRTVDHQPDEITLDPAERGLSVTLGLAMLAFSASRGRSLKSLVLAAAGGYLAHRGVTGRCALYERLEAEALEDERLGPGDHVDGSVEAAATVARPADEVYAFWRALENAPRFMAGIESVEPRGAGRSLWTRPRPGRGPLAMGSGDPGGPPRRAAGVALAPGLGRPPPGRGPLRARARQGGDRGPRGHRPAPARRGRRPRRGPPRPRACPS